MTADGWNPGPGPRVDAATRDASVFPPKSVGSERRRPPTPASDRQKPRALLDRQYPARGVEPSCSGGRREGSDVRGHEALERESLALLGDAARAGAPDAAAPRRPFNGALREARRLGARRGIRSASRPAPRPPPEPKVCSRCAQGPKRRSKTPTKSGTYGGADGTRTYNLRL